MKVVDNVYIYILSNVFSSYFKNSFISVCVCVCFMCLTIMCLCVVFFVFILHVVNWTFWMCRLIYFLKAFICFQILAKFLTFTASRVLTEIYHPKCVIRKYKKGKGLFHSVSELWSLSMTPSTLSSLKPYWSTTETLKSHLAVGCHGNELQL